MNPVKESWPSFLIIGAAKAGTTALYEYLKQHPAIFMSAVKEPHFFCFEGQNLQFAGPPSPTATLSVTEKNAYQRLFANTQGFAAVGEASPFYMYYPQTAENIKKYIPRVKLIAVLRNPVERAYSNYQFNRRDEKEPLHDFRAALQIEVERAAQNWGPIYRYKGLGFYYQQLARYYEQFPAEQIRVYLYDDFNSQPLPVIQDICRFLGVEDTFTPDMSYRHNPSGIPKSRVLHNLINSPNILMSLFKVVTPVKWRRNFKQNLQKRNLQREPFNPVIRAELVEVYRADISQLSQLLGRDLSHWLK